MGRNKSHRLEFKLAISQRLVRFEVEYDEDHDSEIGPTLKIVRLVFVDLVKIHHFRLSILRYLLFVATVSSSHLGRIGSH